MAVRDHVRQVELARELGFSSVWTSQHSLSQPFLYLQSVPLLGRVAAAAEGMPVGTAILVLTLLNAVEVAENAATLDAIAGGRFVLGVGWATERSKPRHSASPRSELTRLSARSTSSGGG